jgi:hypothetical protein
MFPDRSGAPSFKSLNHDVTQGASNVLWVRDGDGHTEVERRMAPKSRRPQSGHTQGKSGECRPHFVERK